VFETRRPATREELARDYRGQFVVELAGFLASCLGALLYVRLGLKRGEF